MSTPRWALALVVVLTACASSGELRPSGQGTEPTETPTSPTSPTVPTVPTGPTTTTPGTRDYAKPRVFEVSCERQDNALRFDCHVTVDPPQPVEISFVKADGTGPVRVRTSAAVAAEHDLVLYYMAPVTDYAWTAYATTWPEDPVATGTVTTDDPPGDVPDGIQVTGTSSVPMVGTHNPCSDTAIATIFDTSTGELIWYQGMDLSGSFNFFEMIQFTEDFTVLGQTGDHVIEVDLLGNVLLELTEGVDYDEDLHHDLFKKNGYIYAIFNDGFMAEPILDGFHVFDASTGAKVVTWFSGAELNIPGSATGDWMHTNTIWVDDAGDVYLSSYGQNTILKIEGDWTLPEFGDQLWALAGASGASGFGSDFAEDWSAVGGADTFTHQHNVQRMDDGRLILLDNVGGRGLVVALDDVAMTADFTEAYKVIDGVCGPQGTADWSSAGNLFFGCSGIALSEFSPTAPEPVWEATAVCPGGFASVVRWYALEGW